MITKILPKKSFFISVLLLSIVVSSTINASIASAYNVNYHNNIPSSPIGEIGASLLWALNMQEASGRQFIQSRYEPGFYNRYLRNHPIYKEDEKKYGRVAISSSYGPWQIMYTTAVEMGYTGEPWALAQAHVSLPYVIKYLQKLSFRFDGNVQKIISAYNAGPGGVGTNPIYTQRVIAYLREAPSNWQVYGT